MDLIRTWWHNRKTERRLAKLKAAFAVVEAAGYFVCNIQVRGSSRYLVDDKGVFYKIGKRA